ncbi:MAG TPA: hypothetical protein VF635_10955 [Propionibacteriaceae bacterium]|jgi:hypothetical protein
MDGHATPLRTTHTHTLEVDQIDELNRRLAEDSRAPITAKDLGLEGARLLHHHEPGAVAPGSSLLVRLCWDGPPGWPYIHAHFAAAPGTADSLVVDLHTAALRLLSQRLHVRQVWGL